MGRGWGAALGVALTYMGSVIGAGYASGQELAQFFLPYGHWGLAGAALAGLLLAIAGFLIVAENRGSLRQLLVSLLQPKLGGWMEIWNALSFSLGLSIMFSASGALFREQLGLPAWAGIAISAILVFGAVLARAEGVLLMNTLSTPFLLAVTLAVIAVGLLQPEGAALRWMAPPNPLTGGRWWVSAILYASYNLVLGAAVLAPMGEVVEERWARRGAALGGAGLGLLTVLMLLAMFLSPAATHLDLPMLYLAGRGPRLLQGAYAVGIWLAILTTAVANAYGLAGSISAWLKTSHARALLVTVLGALPLAGLGFSRLVASFYPLFGYAGLFLLVPLLGKGIGGLFGKRY